MIEINIKLKIASDKQPTQSKKAEPQNQKQINWKIILILVIIVWSGMVFWVGHLLYRNQAKIKNVLLSRVGKFIIQKQVKPRNNTNLKYLKIGNPQPALGEYINGHQITSLMGWRIHPITSKKEWHNGVDIATPVNTPLYAIADGINICKNQPGGAGIYNEFNFKLEKDEITIRIFHLNECFPGKFKSGELIAKTGNTGRSTGPHAHIELQKNKQNIEPSREIIRYSLQPFDSRQEDGTQVALKNIEPNIAAFLDTIAYAEGTYHKNGYRFIYGYEIINDLSRHPEKIICRNHHRKRLCSSAAGRYQFMPDTWNEVRQSDFSPESQDKAAIELLNNKGILPLIKENKIALAIYQSRYIWASFPGNNYGQRQLGLQELLGFYEKRRKKYETQKTTSNQACFKIFSKEICLMSK